MIRYLSVIRDSFREALASRVLWLVLLLITALLAAVAPFRWVSTVAAELSGADIRNIRELAAELQRGSAGEATELQKKILSVVRDETRQELEAVERGTPGPHRFIARRLLAEDLNQLIEQEDFFQPQLWQDVQIGSRLESLQSQAELSPELLRQKNRLALEAALPGLLKACPEESVRFQYASWELEVLPAMTRRQAEERINFVLMIVLPLFVGFFGIFAAILVTAPIIPNMLASGSLNLLLSKPVARPLLFLAKFIGGCSFVLINVVYLVVGILLILGARFQIWKPELLWAVPIFLFSFAIFYSVSSVSGLIWRSTVLAVAMTALFWFACVSVGGTRGLMLLFTEPGQIHSIVASDSEVFVQRGDGGMGRWDEGTQSIEEIMVGDESRAPFPIMGAGYKTFVYDQDDEMLLALKTNWSDSEVYAALKVNGWQRELPTKAPKNSYSLFMREGKPTIVAADGVYALTLAQAEDPLADINIFGLKIPAPTPKDSHEKISSDLPKLPVNTLVAYSSADDRIYLHDGKRLIALTTSNGLFEESNQVEADLPSVVGGDAGEGVVVLCAQGEEAKSLHVFDGVELRSLAVIPIEEADGVRSLSVSEDGHWAALLFEDQTLGVFDLRSVVASTVESQQSERSAAWSNTGISAATFIGNQLWTANTRERMFVRSLPGAKVERRYRTSLSWLKWIYHNVVNPIYLVFPKPSELENTMSYALTGKDTQKVDGPGMGPNGRTVKLDPWQPLYSNSAFIALMLAFGCWYIHRQDF